MVKLQDVDQTIYEPFGEDLLKCKICNSPIVASYHKKHIESDKHRRALQTIDPADIYAQVEEYEEEMAKMMVDVVKLTERMYHFKQSHKDAFIKHLQQMDQCKDAKSYRLSEKLKLLLSK